MDPYVTLSLPLALLAMLPGQATFIESHLRLGNPITSYQRADLNEDGREDMILVERDGAERVLNIFYQAADGHFPSEPATRIPAKKDVIAYTIANVRDTPGLELVFFTHSAAFSYSPTKEGYRDNIEKLFQSDWLLDLPDPDDLPFLNIASDLDGDGWGEIVLPVEDGYDLFARSTRPDAPTPYERVDTMRLSAIPRDNGSPRLEMKGERGRFTFTLQSPYRAFLIDDRATSGTFLRESFMSARTSVCVPRLYDVDGDGLRDIVTQNLHRLEIWLQKPGLSFPQSSRRVIELPSYLDADVDPSGRFPRGLIPIDIDGDQLPDLVARGAREKGLSSREIVFNFFLNRGGELLREEPSYRLKLTGFEADLETVDVDGDHRNDLLVNVWDAPLGPETALSGVRIVLETYLFLGSAEKVYERSPALKLSTSYRPEQLQNIGQSGFRAGDFDGDGLMDLCGTGLDGAVTITRIVKHSSLFGGSSLALEDEPLYRYMPERKIDYVEVADLNGDAITDLMLRFKNEITVLASTRGGR
jgi:hypothetical protein